MRQSFVVSRMKMREIMVQISESKTPITVVHLVKTSKSYSESAAREAIRKMINMGLLYETKRSNGYDLEAQRTCHLTRRGKEVVSLTKEEFLEEMQRRSPMVNNDTKCSVCGTGEEVFLFRGSWICGGCMNPDYEVEHGLRAASSLGVAV